MYGWPVAAPGSTMARSGRGPRVGRPVPTPEECFRTSPADLASHPAVAGFFVSSAHRLCAAAMPASGT
jgi:hypothetical protein